MKGTIKRLVAERGFGFIRTEQGQEFFFHRSGLRGCRFEQLQEGEPMDFDLEKSEKGPRAGNVRRTSDQA